MDRTPQLHFMDPRKDFSLNNRSVYLWMEGMANEEHLKQEGEFTYIDVGDGPPLIFLHVAYG